MQDYIIWGAGGTGCSALYYLGWHRVRAFVDKEKHDNIDDKKVLTIEELKSIDKSEYILVIASDKYCNEIEEQVKIEGIERYFVFHECYTWKYKNNLPFYLINRKQEYMSYTQILSHYPIRDYKNIFILGVNLATPLLVSEIAVTSDFSNIGGIVSLPLCDNLYTEIMGIQIRDDLKALEAADCIIINTKRCEYEADFVCENYKADIIDIFDIDRFIPMFRHLELESLKNIYHGKRVFLIGNGPSMTVDDLNTLWRHGEFCIGFNKIYRIFNETEWRPDYIGITDANVMEQVYNEIMQYNIPLLLTDIFNQNGYYHKETEGNWMIHMMPEVYMPNHPRFSDDITRGVFWGGTSIYDLGLQISAYMGVKEIYLLGCDNSFSANVTDSENHFIKDYFKDSEKESYENVKNTVTESVKAYEKAEDYSRKHGFRIYNATRGGKLEVFERVNFDDLF